MSRPLFRPSRRQAACPLTNFGDQGANLGVIGMLAGDRAGLFQVRCHFNRTVGLSQPLQDSLESFDIAPLTVLKRGGGTVALDASAVLAAR